MDYFIYNNKLYSISIACVIGILCTACTHKQSARPKSDPPKTHAASAASSVDSSKKKLKNAPDFTLTDRKGNKFTLSDHKGQVVVLNFWATWCPPCRHEIPDFIKIQKQLRDKGVLFVGVSVDRNGWKVVRPFAKKFGINYPIVVDNGSVTQKYGPFRGIPTTFIINKKGKIRYAVTGMINGKALKPVLKKMAKH